MAKPQGDLSDVPRRLERMHRASMPENVGRHALLADGRLLTVSGRDMLREDVLEPGARHGAADRIEEQLGIAALWTDGKPSLQSGGGLLP